MKGLGAVCAIVPVLVSGCASYGVVENAPLKAAPPVKSYSIEKWNQGVNSRQNDVEIVLAFSGGGTRASAFSYGVLKALRNMDVSLGGRPVRLLDEVDMITSVSGGSFTAAYYGLHGERVFTDFETVFLRRDVESALKSKLFNPSNWFARTGRTEWTVQYFDQNVFHGATFADLIQKDRPLIVINASDLATGVRFSFVQEYFDLLCSDLGSFPLARAVTASSAVPLLFNPIVVENHPDCGSTVPGWLREMRQRATGDERLIQLVSGLETYFDKDMRRYAHLVDGGITDNLGLLAEFDTLQAIGGPKAYLEFVGRTAPRHYAVIAVNAATRSEPLMDTTNRQPSLMETVDAMSDIQLQRYNTETTELMKQSMLSWAKEVSTPDRPMSTYFIHLSFRDAPPAQREFLNRIPTSLSLTDEQVDQLIATAGELLRSNPEFRHFLAEIAR